jgi:hypothetical protein
MTNIGVFSKPYQTEDRSWLLTELEDAFKLSGTLDITTLTKATHYANYYVPSGLVVGKVTASGLYGPYDDTAVDGRQTAVGYLASATLVVDPTYTALAKVGIGIIAAFAAVSIARLPFNSGNAATGRGYIDAAGQVDLKNIYHAA